MRRAPRRQRGFSIIELVVALLIGLFVVGAVLIGYLGASTNARRLRALAAMTEDAEIALQLMARDVRMAGDMGVIGIDLPAAGTSGHATLKRAATFQPLKGCSQGFDLAQKKAGDSPCLGTAATDADALLVSYQPTDKTAFLTKTSTATPAMMDCAGTGLSTSATDLGNFYFVDKGQGSSRPDLYCDSTAAFSKQPLVAGVEALRFRYAVVANWDAQDANSRQPVRYVSASGVTNWSNVVAVHLCVLMQSTEPVLTSEDTLTYKDCDGQQQSASDHLLRRAFHTTVALRNRALFQP